MKKLILTTVAVAGLALSASAAFAHGHVVTGPMVYATPETSQAQAPAPQQSTTAHKTRIIRHTHAPAANSAS